MNLTNLTLRDLLDVPIIYIVLFVMGTQIVWELSALGLKSLIREVRGEVPEE